tara:strand:+ start:1414 stop:3948 length:2535 start_codon:yes stop_codon:yes gene_type:complete
MAKETRKVHISVTSNASKDLNKGTVAAKGLSGSLKGVGASANLATGGIRAMTMALISSGVGVFIVAVGALIGGIGGLIKKSMAFEKALSTLKAVTGATSEDMLTLKNLAKELGSTTAFTASQVVELQTELAKLGFKTKDIENATGSILDLAASLEVGLAEAAEFTGSVVNSFGLKTKDTQRVVDVMAKSTSSSALSFSALRESLKLVAPVSSSLDVSLEKTTALLGVLADRGIKGSMAGTGLAATFIMLSQKGLTLEQGLAKVKDSGYDLNTAIGLVGKVAGKSFLGLAKGAEDIGKLEQAFIDAEGAANAMALDKLNNLAGDITVLGSAWEGFMLSLEDGSGVLNKLSRLFIQGLGMAISGTQKGLFKLGKGWDGLMLAFDAGGLIISKMSANMFALSTKVSLLAVDMKESLKDVPIIGGLIGDSDLAARRKQLEEQLEEANKTINHFAEEQFKNKQARDKNNVEYRLGHNLKEHKKEEEQETELEKKKREKKNALDEKQRQKDLDAKKAFLARLKKLDQDTDDTTALEKIQRKRERHLEELKTIKMTTDEREKAKATIEAMYDQQRDAQIVLNNEKRKKIFDDFTKQFALQDGTAEENIEAKREAHLAELEQLKLDETEKEEAKLAIKNFYDGQIDAVNAAKRVTKQEQDEADLEAKKMLISQGLDLAIQASGEESKIGQALLKIKQGLALAEMLMKMKVMVMNLKASAQEGIQGTAIKGAEQSASIGVGVANSAKLGFPFNAIPLAMMAAQSVMMVQNMAKSKKEMKRATRGLGVGGFSGGASAIQAPNFNVIGQTTNDANLIADTVAGANSRPIRAFVVDKDVTSSQELSRNTETIASIG